ncbi:hypothetical protein [Paraliomyxa miuraensis]|uniref:hypothetical protein n=1 Tax=Paraliomyxa miuraensis TaxID=376150 RepID=UPI00224D88BD|nr:hypothetical protein [Paraliomyxa miuraensis]MCX4247426.1 hypothetical protein [Paraliomyxa miuraensis]
MPRTRLSSTLLVPSFVASLAASTAVAAPNDVCVRQAQAVPGAASKTPEWWNPGLSESQHEVRWNGATVRTDDDSATPELGRSRMIWDKSSRTVFFELEVNGDPSVDANQDLVLLSVANAAGTAPELFISFQPLRGCTTVSNCTGNGAALSTSAIRYSAASASGTSVTWGPLSGTNPNPAFTIDHPWVQVRPVTSGGTTTYNWTLRFAMQVPVESGHVRPNLRIYGNAVMYMPGPTSGTAVEMPLLCNPSSPTSNDCLMFSSGSTSSLPESLPTGNMGATWPVLESANPSTCEGVEVLRPLLGSDYNTTMGVVPGTGVPYELPGTKIPSISGARLRAGFHNDTDQVLQPGSVTAEFRIANWGLQTSDWHNATWSLVGTAELNAPVSAGGYAGGLGEGRLQSDLWVPSSSELALENTHQCMHVRLRSSTGVDFKVDSAFRNMDLVSASVARRPAVIDLGDRPLPKGKSAHEVYLLVRSEHMPDPGVCKATKGRTYGCAKGGSLLAARRALTKKQRQQLSKDFKAGRARMNEDQYKALLAQKERKGKKPEELPYYVVHGMVDTGMRINLPDAAQTPVLMRFSDYGYYVEHEGEPVEGWESYVHGAEPVGSSDNLFKISVKPKTLVSVANTVRVLSKETKACKKRPKPQWGVYDTKKVEAIEAKIQAEVGKGKLDEVAKVRVTDDQLGCDPPPLRLPCKAGKCAELSPAATIEGNRFAGDWSAITRRPAKKKPTGKVTPKPTGPKPTGKTGPAGKVGPRSTGRIRPKTP